MKDIKVSIICDTYNQEDYIADALESFLAQEADFCFEVLVHDDASTDRTAQIIAEYAERYPDIVKPFYEEVNQYQLGAPRNYAVQSARVQGAYVALCEGDDYWTDPRKLQLQYEALERHKELDICVHAGERVQSDTGKSLGVVRPKDTRCIIPVEDVIMGGGDYVVTNSIFMRAQTYVHPPQILKTFNLDYMIQIWGSMRGGMYYIDRCMSAYRIASKGSFSSATRKSKVKVADTICRVIGALQDLDAQTDYVCTKPIQDHIDELEFRYYGYLGELKKAFGTRTWKSMSVPSKVCSLPMTLYNCLGYRLEKARSR